MVLNSLFPRREFLEGASPEKYDINWTDALTQDITNALAVHTYTLNHTETGNLFNIFDPDLTNNLQWAGANVTTTLILDLGLIAFVHSVLIALSTGGGAVNKVITTSYSENNVDYIQIDTDTNAADPELSYVHSLIGKKLRYIKIVFTSGNAANAFMQFDRIRLIR